MNHNPLQRFAGKFLPLFFWSITLASAPLAHAQPPHFSQPLYIPGIPSSPTNAFYIVAMETGELNNDGKLDLLVRFRDEQLRVGNHLNVYLGNGNGTFKTPTTYYLGSDFIVKVGDVDNDGTNDIVASCYTNQLRIFFGRGDGTFGAPTNLNGEVSTPYNSLDFEMGDFNGDGRTDIVKFKDEYVWEVLINEGNRSFSRQSFWYYTGYLYGLKKGDFNLDGKLDILAPVNSSDFRLFLGNGDGTFQLTTNYQLGTNLVFPIHVMDVNHDNKLDILSMSEQDGYIRKIFAFLGQGDGTFPVEVQSLVASDQKNWFGWSPWIVADLDGDTQSDAVISINRTNRSSLAAILLGQGDGSFSNLISIDLGVSTSYLVQAYAYPALITTGDFNGDGKPDLVAAGASLTATSTNRKYDIAVLLNGVPPPPVSFALPGIHTMPPPGDAGIYRGSTTCDLNADGNLDLLEIFNPPNPINYPTLRLWLGNGQGNFIEHTNFSGSYFRGAQVADFDSDLNPDIVWGDEGENSFGILFGKPDGGYDSPTFLNLPAIYNMGQGSIHDLETGDFNQDGKPDVVGILQKRNIAQSLYTNILLVALNQDNRAFSQHAYVINQQPDFDTGLEKGDFNGDGKLDLVIAASDLKILLGNGDGTFQVRTNLEYLESFITGDVNADGKTDILGIKDDSNGYSMLTVLLAGGDDLFLPEIQTQLPYSYYGPLGAIFKPLSTGDFNGDGYIDVSYPQSLGNTIQILLGNGSGNFVSTEYLQWEGHYPFQVSVHFGQANGASAFGSGFILNHVHACDANNDSKPDLVLFGTDFVMVSNIVTSSTLHLYTLLNTTKPNPRFDSVSLLGQGTKLIFHGTPGKTYTLEYSTNLLNWSEISTLTNQTGTLQFTDPSPTNSPHRFYRARKMN